MRKNRRHLQGWGVAAFFLLNVFAQPAMAQEDPAKALHKAGKAAMEEGDKLEQKGQHEAALAAYSDACQKFGQALALSPKRPTTGMALALCHAASGKPASALQQLRLAKEWAEAGPESPANAQIAAASAAKISEIEVIVPRLQLKIPENIRKTSGLTISENGHDIPDAKWDADIFVDPGTITIRVAAPTKNAWSGQFEAAIGKVTEVAITPDWKKAEEGPVPPQLLPVPEPPSKRRLVGFVGIGVGGAALVTGAVLGGVALSKNTDSKADNHCDASNACDDIGLALRLDAQKIGNASTAMFVVGGVLAATGVILVATAPAPEKKSNSNKDVQAGLWVGPTGVAVRGTW